jgi:lipoprotein signal peptidase
VKIPWKNLAESQEQYCLRYESKHLCVLGDAIEYFISGAVSMATQEALKYTVLSGRQKYKYQVWGKFLIFVLKDNPGKPFSLFPMALQILAYVVI